MMSGVHTPKPGSLGAPPKSGSIVGSASDDRTANNAVRHTYRVLSDAEKAQMVAIKDKGAEFLDLIYSLRRPAMSEVVGEYPAPSRELDIAAERVEEAVMWAVKHLTA